MVMVHGPSKIKGKCAELLLLTWTHLCPRDLLQTRIGRSLLLEHEEKQDPGKWQCRRGSISEKTIQITVKSS